MSQHFTIVIPTRERSETLGYAIQSCLAQNYDDLSVIVSDNASTDGTEELVRAIRDPRLTYINPGHRLSMSSHFNFAVAHVRDDGIVTCIGDDDAIMPGALQSAANLVKSYPSWPIACSSVYYGWPRLPEVEISNRLFVRFCGDYVEERYSRAVIADRISFKEKCEGYIWGMPGVYRGFVPAEMIRKGVSGNRYINSVTPDAYSAFLTCLQAKRYVYTSQPLFVEGVSAKSNGAAQALFSASEEEARYLAENDIDIHSETVYCPSPAFVMVEAFLKVKKHFPQLAAGLSPNFEKMCVRARSETTSLKMDKVRTAIDQIRQKHGFSEESKFDVVAEAVTKRFESIRKAIQTASVDCERCGVRDVYGASLIASALWHCKAKKGIQSGGKLLAKRLGLYLRRKLHQQSAAR